MGANPNSFFPTVGITETRSNECGFSREIRKFMRQQKNNNKSNQRQTFTFPSARGRDGECGLGGRDCPNGRPTPSSRLRTPRVRGKSDASGKERKRGEGTAAATAGRRERTSEEEEEEEEEDEEEEERRRKPKR